jgi:hypothetical protein
MKGKKAEYESQESVDRRKEGKRLKEEDTSQNTDRINQ